MDTGTSCIDYRKNIQNVIDQIEADITEEFTLNKLSRIAGISEFHFSRIFSRYTGLPPITYVRRRKLINGIVEISENKNILEIALKYGFSSNTAFTKSFKKIFGTTPRMYRKIKMNNIPPKINVFTNKTRIGDRIMKAYETETLIIRNFKKGDWKLIQNLAIDKEKSDTAYFDHEWPITDEGCQQMEEYFCKDNLFWAVCKKDELDMIGFIAFNITDDENTLDFGHIFHTDYMNPEIMTEAIQRMIQYVFDEFSVNRIITNNAIDWKGQNEPLKRLGMDIIGEEPASFRNYPDGTPREFIARTYEMTRNNWNNINQS